MLLNNNNLFIIITVLNLTRFEQSWGFEYHAIYKNLAILL